ncbi:MAG: hypothetical protein HY525_09605 [Betaproteobacteria bacterium]|nr:hypothetical protein [Betaproteobacteria bacterium]
MRRDLFQPTEEGQARLLLLINSFSGKAEGLEGRTKLAKLDFLLRYPNFLRRALEIRAGGAVPSGLAEESETIEERMVRYRYGPWDPAYFALLGALIGKGLVMMVPGKRGVGYRTTPTGKKVATRLASSEPWRDTAARVRELKTHFDLRGTTLKEFIYRHFPEVASATWGRRL